MITFNDIYEALRKEKYSDKLQLLPPKFLQDVSVYFREKQEFLAKEDDMFSEMVIKNKKKFENALSSFKDLLRVRKRKILNLSFVTSEVGVSKKDFENLLGFEKELYETIVKAMQRSEEDRVMEMKGEANAEFLHKLVRFLEDVPEFLDSEGEAVGPFQKGEVANLDVEIVDILEKDKRVEPLNY
jgi:DNA replication initiation complex subunit (GINS family)